MSSSGHVQDRTDAAQRRDRSRRVWLGQAGVLIGMGAFGFLLASHVEAAHGLTGGHGHVGTFEAVAASLLVGAVVVGYLRRQYLSRRSDALQIDRVEHALADTSARYRSLFEFHPHGVYSLDREGRFTEVNAACTGISGYSTEELRGRPFVDILPPEEIERMVAVFGGLLEGRPTEFGTHVRHQAGHRVEVRVTGIPMVVDGDVVGVYGITEDVTKERRLQEAARVSLREAREANEAKSLFLANVGHEIRTPLATLLGYAEMLADEDLPPHQAKFVDTMQRAGQRVVRLVDDILDFTRLQAGTVQVEQVPFAVRRVLADLLAQTRAAADRKGLSFDARVDEAVPEQLVGDADRTYQVLTNLLENAVKFTDAGSVRLDVRMVARDDGTPAVAFEVTDTGIGIPADRVTEMFQPFTQADPSATRRHGGTGLGLAIAEQLARRMGGVISVTSTPGEGSTFGFRLPALLP